MCSVHRNSKNPDAWASPQVTLMSPLHGTEPMLLARLSHRLGFIGAKPEVGIHVQVTAWGHMREPVSRNVNLPHPCLTPGALFCDGEGCTLLLSEARETRDKLN